ncbi:hypothetical protein HYT56_05480 [Candidatus Woesearchaeota archaeon]|nr:hypothetical protein [Candidatus Woesearchaeota archaeon]
MGKSIHIKKVLELFEKSPVVDFKSIERIIGIKSGYAKLLISNLIKEKRIYKVAKGCYTRHKDSSLAVLCFKPGYLGLQSSLSIHNLWRQEVIPVIITSKKIRPGLRKIIGSNALIKRAKKNLIFGIDYIQDGDFYLPYSDIEKTFIDMVFFRQTMSKEVINKFKEKIDDNKLKRYLKHYPKNMKEKVTKYFKQ